jgi:hypothetical protein
MNLLSKEDLLELMESREDPSVSIFMPAVKASDQIQQNPIRFKNTLTQAEEQLEKTGLRSPQVNTLLEPAKALLEDDLFWQHQSDGLAVFLSMEDFHVNRLPLEMEELVVVSDRFHIKPLLPLFTRTGHFYILTLSQNEIRLFQATRHSIDQIEIDDTPTNLAEALRFEDPERQIQFHTSTGPSPGSRRAMFHGHGAPPTEEKKEILRYFHQVDDGVSELLNEPHPPLVLAGVDYLLPLYRQASEYPALVKDGIEGNPEELSPQEIHEQAWPRVKAIFAREVEQAINRFKGQSESEGSSTELDAIVKAAYHGKVDTLFAPLNTQIWGSFDPEANLVARHLKSVPGDEDLTDFAAVHTLKNGGAVYTMPQENIPSDSEIAAIFRY